MGTALRFEYRGRRYEYRGELREPTDGEYYFGRSGALVVKAESQRLVPIDFGILRSSAFIRKTGISFNTKMQVGYSTAYAIYVHENPEARHAEGTQDKFLEDPLKNLTNDGTILRIVLAEASK